MKILKDRSLASCRAFRLLWLRFKGLGDLVHDGFGGFSRVGGLGDGPAYDEETGTGFYGSSGGGDALLVASASARRTDARNHQNTLGTGESAQRAHFLRGADKAIDTRCQSHAGQKLGLFGGRAADCDGLKLLRIHTGEDGDGEQLRRVWDAFECGAGGGEHGRATKRMESDHARAMCCGGAHCPGHRVGDIVQLEIEEDGMAAVDELFDYGWASGGEELQADFEPVAMVLEAVDEIKGSRRIGRIQGHDQPAAGFFQTLERRSCTGKGGVQPIGDGHNEIVMHRPNCRGEQPISRLRSRRGKGEWG